MMSKNARILMLAAAPFVVLGSALLATASGAVPALQGLVAEAGPTGPVIHVLAEGELETVHYSPQPGVWVIEMPEAAWDEGVGLLSEPQLGIERAELEHVEEFGKRVTRLTVVEAPAQPDRRSPEGVDLQFTSRPACRGGRPSAAATPAPAYRTRSPDSGRRARA
jgi:hypothetical protein